MLNSEFFFVRTEPSTTELSASQAHEFVIRFCHSMKSIVLFRVGYMKN